MATLKWFNGDKELVSIYLTRDNYASAEVAFVPKGQDNGGQLRCEATNMASMQPLVVKRNLTVDFAPEFVKVSVRPDRPRAGHNATLVCETVSYFTTFYISLRLYFMKKLFKNWHFEFEWVGTCTHTNIFFHFQCKIMQSSAKIPDACHI